MRSIKINLHRRNGNIVLDPCIMHDCTSYTQCWTVITEYIIKHKHTTAPCINQRVIHCVKAANIMPAIMTNTGKYVVVFITAHKLTWLITIFAICHVTFMALLCLMIEASSVGKDWNPMHSISLIFLHNTLSVHKLLLFYSAYQFLPFVLGLAFLLHFLSYIKQYSSLEPGIV